MRSFPQKQVELVFRQMARTAGFRGFSPGFLLQVAALSGAMTCLAVALSATLTLGAVSILWCAGAVMIMAFAVLKVIAPALNSASTLERETAREVIAAILPPLGVGGVISLVVLLRFGEAVPFLPCIWLMLFGLAVSALGPLVFAATEFVVAGYLIASAVAFLFRSSNPLVFTVLVGAPFTGLHLLTGLVLRSARGRSRGGET